MGSQGLIFLHEATQEVASMMECYNMIWGPGSDTSCPVTLDRSLNGLASPLVVRDFCKVY